VPTYGKRRSERVLLDVPIIVRGQAADKQPFREEAFTLTVSAHGALMLLSSRVELGQKLVLRKAKTAVECEANVAFLGPPYAGLSTVGVEFERPSPEFWPVLTPPADWHRNYISRWRKL
jgi:PilZ domain